MRTRNFVTVVYPESSPDFLDILSDLKIPCLVSPLHDKDINPTKEIKKAHYHIILLFDSVKTIEQAREVIFTFKGVGCEAVKSLRAYARYLCHLDNPDKAQYSIDDVVSFFGADYLSLIECQSDKYSVIREIIAHCNDNNIVCFCTIVEYSMKYKPDWFRHLCSDSAYIIKEYLKSKGWYLKEKV